MQRRDIVDMVTDVFTRRQPAHGQYMGGAMPTMTRFYFGANDPASVYSIGAPRVPRGIMGQMAEQPPAPNPTDMRLAAGTQMAPGTVPYVPSPDAEIPAPRAIPLPPERPAEVPYDAAGFGSYSENVAPKAAPGGFDTKTTGGRLKALGGGGDGGRAESMYAPLPGMISPGLAGTGGGRDVDFTRFLRGMLRR